MTKADKRESRIRENIRNVIPADLKWLIKRYGRLEHGGNHPIACIGNVRYPYKRQNPVDYHYVKDILGFIDRMQDRANEYEKES